MAEANWYWAEGENRNGPVAGSAIARLVADGKLGADDMIWKEGMAEWIPVRKVPALVKYLKQPVAAEPSPSAIAPQSATATISQPALMSQAPAAVGYYNPAGGLPPRAAATLRGHAPPRGDVGDWPLDDAQVGRFDEALKMRKRIDSAVSLYKLLLVIALIGNVGSFVGFAAAFTGSRGPSSQDLVVASGILAAGISFTVLYYLAWKATVRSKRWASLTFGILFSLIGAVYFVALLIAAANSPRDGVPLAVGGFVILLFAGLFAFVSFRAFAAIPVYLHQPAWCQELLCKTSK